MNQTNLVSGISNLSENAETKSILGLFTGVLLYFRNSITEIFVILLILLLLDYITGVVQGMIVSGGFSWEKAWMGVVKKLMYAPILILGLAADYVIKYMAEGIGIQFGISGLIGIACCIYLIGTEGFSIIQNLLLLGIPAPEFIQKIFGLMKDQAGRIVKMPVKQEGLDEDNE